MGAFLDRFRRRRDRRERDLDRELRYHVDRLVEDLMADGLSEADARRRATLEFGGIPQVRDAVRDTWTWAWLDAARLDLRDAVRSLRRSPVFTLGVGAVLALTIGATTAVFSIVDAVLIEPPAYPDADRLVSIETHWTNTGRLSQDVSGPDFLDWQARSDVFEAMAVSYGEDDVATVVADRAVFANDRYVSADFFAVFGQAAAAGRLLTARDIPAGEADPAVAVVAHHWAVRHFGTAEAAVGRAITVYGIGLEIVGVAAPGFRYPGASDLWIPWLTTNGGTNRSLHNYQAVGRLKAGVDPARAQAQMHAIGEALAREYPENRLKAVALVPLAERLTGHLRLTLWLVMAAVGLVLVIACANIANLFLARAAGRARELALRAALGAGRGRVARQLLTESGVLTGAAALAGIGLASRLVDGLLALAPDGVARLADVRMDATVLLFACGLSFAATLAFGLLPARRVSRLVLNESLKHGGSKGVVTGLSPKLRSTLVVAEVALSVVLLVAAGLLLRSLYGLQQVDLGFTTDRVVVAYTQYVANTAAERQERTRFYADVIARLREVPGVSAAAGAAYLPMGREPRPARDYFIQGRPEGREGERPTAEIGAITSGYFQALDIPLRAGRDFDEADVLGRPPVAIVNETLARTAFPDASPIGEQIRWNPRAPWMEVVGVVADTRWQDPSRPPPSMLFVPSAQGTGGSLSLLVRTTLDEAVLAGTVRSLLHDADPTVPVRLETMNELFASALAYPRFRTQVIGAFAAAAAALAAVGIFSVLAYLVGQRTRELAVRRALGARSAEVIGLVMGEGLRLTALGLALGLAGALAVARLLESLLYEVSPWDVTTYVAAIAVLGVAAVLATLLPAIRAVSVSPFLVLQQE